MSSMVEEDLEFLRQLAKHKGPLTDAQRERLETISIRMAHKIMASYNRDANERWSEVTAT